MLQVHATLTTANLLTYSLSQRAKKQFANFRGLVGTPNIQIKAINQNVYFSNTMAPLTVRRS